jgi:hypothetical protein
MKFFLNKSQILAHHVWYFSPYQAFFEFLFHNSSSFSLLNAVCVFLLFEDWQNPDLC